MTVLSLSCFVSNAAAALLVDGKLVAASTESRFSRVPGDSAFPERAIRFCLERLRMLTGRAAVDRVACVDRGETPPAGGARKPLAEIKSAVSGWTDKQSLRRRIRSLVDVRSEQIVFVDPLRAHAANAFMSSPFEEAAIIVADGDADHTVTATAVGSGATVDLEAVARQDVTGASLARMAADLLTASGSATRVAFGGSRAGDPCLVAHLLEDGRVTEIFVPPAVDGAGAALGAALHVHHLVAGGAREFALAHPYWGVPIERRGVLEVAQTSGLIWVECDEHELLSRTTDLLALGKVLAWAQEAAEWGPRALGNRSIVCDPTQPDAIGRMPHVAEAPDDTSMWTLAVPAERMAAMFDGVPAAALGPGRFGAVACRPKPAVADVLAMPTHLDGRLAVHVVAREVNPRFHALITRAAGKIAIPALAQTVLASPGEAPANTAADAFKAFRDWKLGALVLDHTMMINDGV
ncbi:MAG TPA: carbamoyltransferase C-terminal domain-containing protein [Vicinamibacterales bacterium]|nr:carbamoyltransferase C-terminal domain-containing protein [Vicinamibacterales bacterium]